MKKLYQKVPFLRHILRSFGKFFLIFAALLAVGYLVLRLTRAYAALESALNLKYNSPWITIPLYGFLALFIVGMVIGLLLYFRRYKRNTPQTQFGKALAPVIQENEKER